MPALSESKRNTITIALLALMLIAFAAISFCSVRTKSATADEPLHWMAGFVRAHDADFRVDAEDPPLAFYWALLPHGRDAIEIDRTASAWDHMIAYPWSQWDWVGPTFYRTAGFDPDAALNRSRAMMTVLGALLGVLIAWWAWRLSGRLAAVISCGLYCFDPNFLGHAPLVKNDAPIALVMIGLVFAIWRSGERVTIARVLAIALLCAASLTTKFSGVVFVPIVIAMLLARALLARPWLVLGRIIARRSTKILVACAIIGFSAIVSYVGIWAAYGFRYSITPDPDVRANFAILITATARNELLIRNPNVMPDQPEIIEQAKHPGSVVRFMLWVNDRHILPEAWTSGFLKTYATTIRRPSFLMGRHEATGWWYYFPLAFLFKTPLATLALLSVAMVVKRGRRFDSWTICSLAIPFAIYGLSALTTHLNLGLRHVFPIVPILFVWAGATLANARAVFPRFVPATLGVLGGALLIESLTAMPNYIAYFNVAAGGSRGGLDLLGDSNLDWGQDLPLLRQWQRDNPEVELILDYFGGCDAGYYVKHIVLLDVSKPEVAPAPAAIGRDNSGRRKVLAVSASKLQGIYPPYSLWPFYDYIRKHKPFKVLGGTIYLYELPLRG